MERRFVLAACLALGACGPPSSPPQHPSGGVPADAGPPDAAWAPPDAAPPTSDDGLDLPPAAGWLKGQLHMHTILSPDSDYATEDAIAFYERRGYDFVVVTDHNHVTVMADCGRMLVIPGVELTFNTTKCVPPPEKKKCLVHVNALFVTRTPGEVPLLEPESFARMDLYQEMLDRALELGGLPMLNHPNFQWTVTPNMAIELAHRGVRLVEVANMGMPISNPGDATHPSTELLWDIVLSSGVDMWAVASDDSHDYEASEELRARGETAYPGDLGWVMVRADRDPAKIRAALARGDFYASSGVLLHELAVDGDELVVTAAGRGPFAVEFVGHGGQVLAREEGRTGRFPLGRAASGYVRARVLGPGGAMAWTQPVRVQ
jgi:hypothetical protein